MRTYLKLALVTLATLAVVNRVPQLKALVGG